MNPELASAATPTAQTTTPQQHEMPLALVHGQPVLQLPTDLYIPPDALEVILDAFAGPLDLLLYLIRRQNLDILDIPVADITRQYASYITVMQELRFELAAEYLVMAAILAEIKSRMLLPRPPSEDEEEGEDPRAELVHRLQEYERFKHAAEAIDALPRLERDTALAHITAPDHAPIRIPPPIDFQQVLDAFRQMLQRAELFTGHAITRELLSVRARMGDVLARLNQRPDETLRFETLCRAHEGKRGVLVTFLALLELAKEQWIEITQYEPLCAIFVTLPAQRAETALPHHTTQRAQIESTDV